MSLRTKLQQVQDALVEFIEPNFGLLDALLACGAVSRRQLADIFACQTVYDRNVRLLACFIDDYYGDNNNSQRVEYDNCCHLLIQSLIKTEQSHIVNFIYGGTFCNSYE
jgi:hypothetical protein